MHDDPDETVWPSCPIREEIEWTDEDEAAADRGMAHAHEWDALTLEERIARHEAIWNDPAVRRWLGLLD
jgi:hypothetical protein